MWVKLGIVLALGVVVMEAAEFGVGAGATRTDSISATLSPGVELAIDVRRPDEQQTRALAALTEPPGSPRIVITSPGGHEHDDSLSATVVPTPKLERQLDSVRRAAVALAHVTRLPDAGYYLGSYYSQGVGTHFIDWRLVGMPFDPARPAMLLVDSTPGHTTRLAGFSYWVRSNGPPAGFDGDADVWHNHRGMCFVNAVMTRENVVDPADCQGQWIDGADLWMLHVWVVPGYDNPDGVFAPTNPKVCPPRIGPDAGWC